jgi:AAA domain
MATSGRRFVSITGPAGTGKGVASGVIAPLWQGLGRPVIALSVAGRTAQRAGHDARADLAKTIDGLLFAIENGYHTIDANTVLLVDEAAMIDHDRYASLLEEAARAEATVIQVGDDRQLSPVGSGGLWTLIHASAKAHELAAELRVVRRANEVAEAQAWTQVREGRVVEALRYWHERGRLRLYDSRRELQAGMVDEWAADRARGVMLVDTSNAERDVMNRLVQERLAQAGELGAEVLTFENGCTVRAGDRVVFRESRQVLPATGPYRVPRIENGTEATVVSVDTARQVAELRLHEPRGERTATVGRDAVLNLAYARHVQLGQGMTAEGAGQVGISTRTDREHFYVMVSRGRAGAVIHAVRSELAAVATPGLGPVTEAQEEALKRLGVGEVPDDWTWADASVEIDARRGTPLGDWAMSHLTRTMHVEPVLAAHLVAQAIARRHADTDQAVRLDGTADSVRAVLPTRHQEPGEPTQSDWERFLTELNAKREEVEARAGLARLLAHEGRKEAVGDRPVTPDPLRNEARRSRSEALPQAREARAADIDYALNRQRRARAEQAAELPLPGREPDLATLSLADGAQVTRGDVICFGHPDWLAGAARAEVQPGDLGVVLGCHRGGVTWDYVTVELVGGRRIEVWQTAQGITVEPDVMPAAVRDAIPRPDQRDPEALNVLELANGARLMAGDQVRFAEPVTLGGAGTIESGTEGRVQEIQRHRHNRAMVQLDDGRWAGVHPLVGLEIVRPAHDASSAAPAVHQGEATHPLAASMPIEQVARWEAADRVPRALAIYAAVGQLHVSPSPVHEVTQLWLADRESAIVVQTSEQAGAVREAIAKAQPASAAAPIVLIADPAYRSRIEAERAGEEPPAPERAYVLAKLDDADALARALSVAHESHLVITPLDELSTQLQEAHASQIEAALEAARGPASEPASRELLIETALKREADGTTDRRARDAEREGADS